MNNKKSHYIHALLIVFLWLASHALPLQAQRNEIFNDRIQSLQVTADDNWMSLPIYELNNGQVTISFDDMTHDYHRYAYKIEHCEADWTTSEQLFDNDFCEGFVSDNLIDDAQQSILTNRLYTHYTFTLPNSQCKPKMSGNYRVTVYDDEDDQKPVFSACFMVREPAASAMGVSLNATANTDRGINGSYQQVAMKVSYGSYKVTDPQNQLHTVLLQNSRWDDARLNARPQYVQADGLVWTHNPQYIFQAGNEYRKFEILSTHVASMGIESIYWDGTDNHAYPFISEPRANYLYDVDADGAFLIRNSDNTEVNTTSDYMMVHFRLRCPEPVKGDVYINANWTQDRFLPRYRMEYNDSTHCYEAQVLLKLGYYSYTYLLVTPGAKPIIMPTEGSFYQTENRYQALVYYRPIGGRTDQLVGYAEMKTQ